MGIRKVLEPFLLCQDEEPALAALDLTALPYSFEFLTVSFPAPIPSQSRIRTRALQVQTTL